MLFLLSNLMTVCNFQRDSFNDQDEEINMVLRGTSIRGNFDRRAPHEPCSLTLGTDCSDHSRLFFSLCWDGTMADKEIIDLTADDREVIILESGDESNERSTKRARMSPPGPANDGGVQDAGHSAALDGSHTGAEGKEKRSRRTGRKKRKKMSVVGDEDGEIIEVEFTEESGQVSRGDSREQTEAEGQSQDVPEKSGKAKAKDSAIRSLLDRLADAEDGPVEHMEGGLHKSSSDSKDRKKRKKKRKRGDSDRERTTTASTNQYSATNEAGDTSLGPNLFYIDDTPADVPTDAKLPDLAPLPKPTSASASSTKADDDKARLLLPAHVSVFDDEGDADESLQIIPPPPSDSENESYIEYLDYDDDRRVRVYCLLTALLC